jgi:hypothetical protein
MPGIDRGQSLGARAQWLEQDGNTQVEKFTERSRNVSENKSLLFMEFGKSRNVSEKKDVITIKPESFS